MSIRARAISVSVARPRLLLALAIVAGTASMASGALAQNYPWCANFHDGAGTNCGFSTEEQCRMTVQGSGGYCDRNTQYSPPGVASPGQRKASHKANPKARAHSRT